MALHRQRTFAIFAATVAKSFSGACNFARPRSICFSVREKHPTPQECVVVFRPTKTAFCSTKKTITKGLQVICMQLLQSRVLLNIFRSTALALGVLASIAIGHGTLNAQSRSASPRVILPLQVGFYHGARALYITPEVGVDPNAPPAIIAAAHQIAKGFNSNFIPTNFGTLPNSPAVDDIFVFTNFTQGNVLASAPHPAGPANTDKNYSPLWQISLVAWNPGYQRRVLKSQAQIENAADAGEVTITKTPIIVECSVIFTPGGGLLPGAKILRDGDQQHDSSGNR